jgi:hypothetical protein
LEPSENDVLKVEIESTPLWGERKESCDLKSSKPSCEGGDSTDQVIAVYSLFNLKAGKEREGRRGRQLTTLLRPEVSHPWQFDHQGRTPKA